MRSRLAKRGLVLARPLLGTWRHETEAYCRENGLDPRIDSSNRSLKFLRNRLRLQVLPLLREINPRVDAALLRLAGSAAEAASFLEKQVDRTWRRTVHVSPDAVTIDRGRFLALLPAVAAHLLRRAVSRARGGLGGITADHVARMQALAAGPTGKRLALPGDVEFSVGYETLRVGRPTGSPVRHRGRSILSAVPPSRVGKGARGFGPEGGQGVRLPPSVTRIPGWEVRVEPRHAPPGDAFPAGALVAFIDADAVNGDLRVRTRLPGDRFQPLGMASSKKLQDFFVDAKVPRESRDGVPILCDAAGILWVVGYRIDQRAAVGDATRQALRVEFVKAGE